MMPNVLGVCTPFEFGYVDETRMTAQLLESCIKRFYGQSADSSDVDVDHHYDETPNLSGVFSLLCVCARFFQIAVKAYVSSTRSPQVTATVKEDRRWLLKEYRPPDLGNR